MLNNGLIYSSIALSSNMLVARFGFDENYAGSSAMMPYMVFALSIPFVVGYVETQGNRMHLIYFLGVC